MWWGNPETISYSDRNALMLANILVRKYNKEFSNDVEITPEEVLLVRDGLDYDTVKSTAGLIEQQREKVFKKIQSTHLDFKAALGADADRQALMPLRYLVTLERESYIFFSLVGGGTSHLIVRGAAEEYGDPNSEIYHLKKQRSEPEGESAASSSGHPRPVPLRRQP